METSSYPRRTLDTVGCVVRPILDSLEEHSTRWGGAWRHPATHAEHLTEWGVLRGLSSTLSKNTRHSGVLSTHLGLLHRPAGSSVISSSLSKEEGESTRNVLSHSGLIAPSPPGRKHTISTLDVFRLPHRSKAYETYSHCIISASVPASEAAATGRLSYSNHSMDCPTSWTTVAA